MEMVTREFAMIKVIEKVYQLFKMMEKKNMLIDVLKTILFNIDENTKKLTVIENKCSPGTLRGHIRKINFSSFIFLRLSVCCPRI